MAVKKITKRWMVNNFGVILVILVALEVGFSFGIKTFYYNSVESMVLTQVNVVASQLAAYAEDSSANYSEQVRGLVEDFQARDRMELMAVGLDKKVSFTSSGFEPGGDLSMPDFDTALLSPDGVGKFVGTIDGEKIMAITKISPSVGDQQLAAMRFAVSLELVDRQIILFILVITLVCIAIIFFVIFSGSYFIGSIVNPVGEVSVTARKIAHGDFNARLTKKNDDEIGELCDTINYMAEELSANDRMKNDFISSVSHELRTPLTAIKGWAETLADMGGDVDPEMLAKGMRVITSETERLAGMVEELLDFSRIQSGRMKLVKDRMDVIAELSEAVLMFEERARHEGKRLIYNEPDQFASFMGDRNRLRQVFVNIIDNALKYSDRGDTVTIRAAVSESQVDISVADTGIGIREEDLPKIKEKFFKANSTRRGSGIGLAVVDEIVSLHGGTLDITSKENVGTRVTIHLPLGNG
ncbi:sensor histidine kinase [Anaerotruncus colihominis]|uniref:histidine kinase n=1 Tax=Anaerotruncus colihominis TaxID=169435 RepID=A0A845T0N2_9FIRM|nr:HAMP domain-containing sensor histidine kinase [Anaerotruncus colihominis]MCR2025593.1 HAMP domain-containing histidine kinase [Anaerotruncus colihominis]NDO39697.1 HAMP domain-containing histidine kinase [Anaerotruncus colihominis]